MHACRVALAIEVKGVKKAPITINMAPTIFNNEVFFISFSPLLGMNCYATTYSHLFHPDANALLVELVAVLCGCPQPLFRDFPPGDFGGGGNASFC